jgi:hypothetical protein
MTLDPSFQELMAQVAEQARATPREPAAIIARERAAVERMRVLLPQKAQQAFTEAIDALRVAFADNKR